MQGPEAGESPKERVDREFSEALDEIRVALPGVQLLFGFLLILPFSQGFDRLTELDRAIYLTSFVLAGGAVALLVAPTAAHRFDFRNVDKFRLLKRVNRQVIAALALIATSIALAAYLVASIVLENRWAAALASVLGAWFATLWFVVPTVRKRRNEGAPAVRVMSGS